MISINDFTDELARSFSDDDLLKYVAVANTEIAVLAEELGVEYEEIDTNYIVAGVETGKPHPKVVEFAASYAMYRLFLDLSYVGNDPDDKFIVKAEIYQKKAAQARGYINSKTLTGSISSSADSSYRTGIIYKG